MIRFGRNDLKLVVGSKVKEIVVFRRRPEGERTKILGVGKTKKPMRDKRTWDGKSTRLKISEGIFEARLLCVMGEND